MPRIASCSSCGRHIIWSISPDGKRLPLDARPVTVYSLDPGTDPPSARKRELHDSYGNVSYLNARGEPRGWPTGGGPSVALHTRSRLRNEADASKGEQ